MNPLGTSHFRKPQRADITALPEIARLSGRLGDALTSGLSTVQPAPWRVTSEGITEHAGEQVESDRSTLRFESAKGSLTAQLGLDRPSISALLEVAMGGTGAEAAFEMADRPLSKIEQRVVQHAYARIAMAIVQELGDLLGRPFDLFEGGQAPELDRSSGLIQFRFVVNVFSYSGEIMLTFARDDLEQQLAPATPYQIGGALPETTRKMQEEVGKSEVILTIMLADQSLPLDSLSGLRPGKLVDLKATATMPVIVWSSGVSAYEATLGRSGDRFAVTIISART